MAAFRRSQTKWRPPPPEISGFPGGEASGPGKADARAAGKHECGDKSWHRPDASCRYAMRDKERKLAKRRGSLAWSRCCFLTTRYEADLADLPQVR